MNEAELKALLASLNQKATGLLAENDTLLGKGDGFTADDQAKVTANNTEVGAIKTRIKSVQEQSAHTEFFTAPATGVPGASDNPELARKAAADAALRAAGADPTQSDDGIIRYMGGQEAGLVVLKNGALLHEEGAGLMGEKQFLAICQPAYKAAWRSYARKGREGMSSEELKTLSEGLDPQGGYLVPVDMIMRLISRRPTPTRLRGAVTEITTSRDRIVMPKLNYSADDLYTTGIRVTWTGETPSSSTVHRVDDSNMFGELEIPVNTAMLSSVLTNDQVEDAAFPLMSWLSDKFGETAELLDDNMILNGSGIKQPFGILLNPGGDGQPAVVLSGSAGAIVPDNIRVMPFKIPEQYIENMRWCFNRTNVGAAVSLMKDQQERYLFATGVTDDGLASGKRPDSLGGYPIAYSGFGQNIGAGNYPIVFGDFSGYYLVRRLGLSVQFLRERYAENNQVGVVGRLRFGGKVAEPWRMRLLKSNNA